MTNACSALFYMHTVYTFVYLYTGYTQKNGAVSKVNKKFISHLIRAQRTPSAAATVQVSHALITILQCVHPGSHDTHPHGKQIPVFNAVYVPPLACPSRNSVIG
jgi:archaellum component FlaF (FlaF/FlaG flagellin family)